jgi:hypothetical protein
MIVRLALVRSRRVISTCDHGRVVPKKIHFDVLNSRRRGFEMWVSDIRKKLLLPTRYSQSGSKPAHRGQPNRD